MKKQELKLARFLRGGSIRKTIFVSFTLIAVICTLFSGLTIYIRYSRQLDSAIQNENSIIVRQVNQSFSSYLRNIIGLASSLNYNVIKSADIGDTSAVSEAFQTLYSAYGDYVDSVLLFSADGELLLTAPYGTLRENADVTGEEWFTKALERTENFHFFTPTTKNVLFNSAYGYSYVVPMSSAVEITRGKETAQGVLLIMLKYTTVSDIIGRVSLSNGGYLYLTDSSGKLIYHPKMQLISTGYYTENSLEALSLADGSYVRRYGDKSQSVIISTVGYTGWRVVSVIDRTGISLDALQNAMFVGTIFMLIISVILLVNYYISKRITDPIERLELSVRNIEKLSEGGEIYVGGSSEVRKLGKTIRDMVRIMRSLANDIVAEHEQQQRSELDALQAQINPHFLYNTLDIIVWMIENEHPEDAVKIVSALAKFFRISLNKGSNIISVGQELEHVRNYLLIQEMRYKNKFNYAIIADEGAESLSTIKLVVQPLVENAIYHGMEFMDGDGTIVVHAKVKDGCLDITVTDNGLGMPKEVVDNLLKNNTPIARGSGVGLKNVNDRIRLYFGGEYGVRIESEPDVGTRITLHMPAMPYSEGERR